VGYLELFVYPSIRLSRRIQRKTRKVSACKAETLLSTWLLLHQPGRSRQVTRRAENSAQQSVLAF
jgi:hypothetical protein